MGVGIQYKSVWVSDVMGKEPKELWWNDVVKAAEEKNTASKDRFMEIYEEEKIMVKM